VQRITGGRSFFGRDDQNGGIPATEGVRKELKTMKTKTNVKAGIIAI